MAKILALLLVALAIQTTLQAYSAKATQFCKKVGSTDDVCTACHNEQSKKVGPKMYDALNPQGCTIARAGVTAKGK